VSGASETATTPDVSFQVDRRRPRNPRVAAILALIFGTVGQVYCGRLLRAVAWTLASLPLIAIVGCLLLYLPFGRFAWVLSAFIIVGYWAGIVVDAMRFARHRLPADKWYQRWWFYVVYSFLVSFLGSGVANLTRSQFAEALYLPTGSMKNTLLPGDRVFVDKLRYRFKPIAHGDVVVFWSDNRVAGARRTQVDESRQMYIKRVVGVPGDTIEIRDEQLFRNGALVDEPYVFESEVIDPRQLAPELRDTRQRTLFDGEYFVLGDNRRNSLDSRMLDSIPRDDIVGKVEIVLWSREASALDPPILLPGQRPMPEPPRKIRWSRFGQRVE